jgi:hypothetical protein
MLYTRYSQNSLSYIFYVCLESSMKILALNISGAIPIEKHVYTW